MAVGCALSLRIAVGHLKRRCVQAKYEHRPQEWNHADGLGGLDYADFLLGGASCAGLDRRTSP